MKKIYTHKIIQSIIISCCILLLSSFNSNEEVLTDGNVSFTVKTVTYDGDRSPKNIVAIWIEDISGNFIKTKLLQADKRKEWLLTWNNKSKGSTVDAITGETINSHQSHTISWDLTDESGTQVADGDYKIVVEFTEEHKQGPMTSVSFTKGPSSQTLTPDNLANFIDVKLEYTVDATSVQGISAQTSKPGIYPNPFVDFTSIELFTDQTTPIGIKIYSLNGKLVREMSHTSGSAGKQSVKWDGNGNSGKHLPPGVYFIQIHMENKILTGQVIKQSR